VNESGALGEDGQIIGRGGSRVCFGVAFEGVDGWDERISRSVEFQMTRVAERKEREPNLLLDGVGTRKCWSEERREQIS